MAYIECSYLKCGNPVFSGSRCRKHYEQERRATAVPCSYNGCTARVYRGALCQTHYRSYILNQHPECDIPGCSDKAKTLKSGLCEKHLFRFEKRGTVESSRKEDWGSREAHPLYKTWCWHRRRTVIGIAEEWFDDFWGFTRAVGDRPEGHTLRKKDRSAPLGPKNWYWKATAPSADKAAYAREWRKKNPDKAKASELKKRFGVGAEWYNERLSEQNGVCAICGGQEPAVSKDGGPRSLAIDHCHKTKKVRALLCSRCNTALGCFKDNPDFLRKAANYIEFYKNRFDIEGAPV